MRGIAVSNGMCAIVNGNRRIALYSWTFGMSKIRSGIFGCVDLCILQPLIIDTLLPYLYETVITRGYEKITFTSQ